MNRLANGITDVLADNLAARRSWDEPPELYWLKLTNGKQAATTSHWNSSVAFW